MKPISTLYSSPNSKRQTGLSLVELMISLTIGLILLMGVTTLIVQQNNTRDELDKSSRQIENGRFAMQILHDDLQHAGFYGQYFILPSTPATLPNPCLVDIASLTAAMPLPIQGYDSPVSVPAPLSNCLADANHVAGTDILVIRRANTSTASIANAAAGVGGQVYLQTNTASAVIGVGAGATITSFPLTYDAAQTIRAPLRSYFVRIYFISPCSTMANGTTCAASDDNGNPIPTLKRLELSASGGNTNLALTPLVEGIENMQMDFGLDNDGDGYPDINSTTPIATTDWSNVMAVRVNLLSRNTEPSVGYSDGKTYTLGLAGSVGPFNVAPYALSSACGGTAAYPQRCNYKRHMYSELISLVNPSGRRAQQ